MILFRDSGFFRACIVGIVALAGGCATPASVPATTQPALSAMAQPYADGLRSAGISTVQVVDSGPRVRVATNFGEIYLRYPAGLSPTAFAVYVDTTSVEVDSSSFTAGSGPQYEAAIKAVLPAAIKAANENNARVITNRFGKN